MATTNNWLELFTYISLLLNQTGVQERASYRWAGIGFEGETGQDDSEIDIEGRALELILTRNTLDIRIGLAKAINGAENPKLPRNGGEEAGLGAQSESRGMEVVTAVEFGWRRGGAVSELER